MTVTGVSVHTSGDPAPPPAPEELADEAPAPIEDWTPGTAALSIPCARCEAKVNDPCTTITGNLADGPHVARWRPLADAFSAGVRDQQARP